jgi:hypothetical protein
LEFWTKKKLATLIYIHIFPHIEFDEMIRICFSEHVYPLEDGDRTKAVSVKCTVDVSHESASWCTFLLSETQPCVECVECVHRMRRMHPQNVEHCDWKFSDSVHTSKKS